MPVTLIYGHTTADETVEAARQRIRNDPTYPAVPEEPVIVEVRFEAMVIGTLPSTGQDLVRRRSEVYWTHRGMPAPRPWMHPPISRLYEGMSRPPVRTRPRIPASELPAAGLRPATTNGHDPPTRGPSGRR